MIKKQIKVIAFDADDTLWVNETYFREAENAFATLLSNYETENKIHQELYKKEIENLPIYGYGIKGFVISMIECALELSNNTINQKTISKIINIGKEMLQKPVIILDGVIDVLNSLKRDYKLIVATKGDLLDQERKLEKSGLIKYFHHVEVMSEKKENDYTKLINHLDIQASEFLMIGNSLKSDVLPLLNIGASAIHIPFHTTWEHEKVTQDTTNLNYKSYTKITDILNSL
ncbi:putative hydrolase of the HAD superfamily [Tenacibaculum sp. MAR_2010_89]|uniref:HAD family hydrolase n=1 Tax=Tenacibaculum sp. MAR_2010_89 TaxID=1250198 RepID=UPI000896CFE4|nr:HAD family hydrolase [Tenacibaculum sp. MAR_2010_89]SEE39090.1 putative hydrolase of the HAD superfamily [Tenacibaculum sp. MAR_2010_89]